MWSLWVRSKWSHFPNYGNNRWILHTDGPRGSRTFLCEFAYLRLTNIPEVNFINVLCVAFKYVSCARSFLCLDFRFVLYWRKTVDAKAVRRTLVKLTPDLTICAFCYRFPRSYAIFDKKKVYQNGLKMKKVWFS